jgi:protein O-mannosyl-transferase
VLGLQLEKLEPTVQVARRQAAWHGKQTWLLSLVLLFATLALYYPVHSYPFINFDDDRYVTDNPYIKTLDLALVKWALLHPYLYNWHPLTWVSHAADIQMFGLDAGWHHEVNVLLHALSAVVLFWVLRRATGFTGRSFMVAALFALHPVNIESVAWIAERKTVLSTLFFFLALGAYRWYACRPKLSRMAVVAMLYGFGLMAKPQVITLPFVLLLWDYWPLRRMFADERESASGAEPIPAQSFGTLLKEKIPLFFICAVDAFITMVAQHGFGVTGPYTLPLRLANALVSYVSYIRELLWPTNLAIMYLHPLKSLHWWQAVLALLFLLAVSLFAVGSRRHRYLIVGWLWFLGTLVPMTGLVHFYVQARADRYAYISGIGIFLMVCWGLADWAAQRHLPRSVLPAASVAALLVLSVVTHRQLGYWKDSLTLWTHTLEVTHPNWLAEAYVGSALRDQRRFDEALPHFYRAAADMARRDPQVYLGIATIEQRRGNLPQAIDFYRKALVVVDGPELRKQIFWNMAVAYQGLGDSANAQECVYQAAHQTSTAVDWHGDWWRHLWPMIQEHLHR